MWLFRCSLSLLLLCCSVVFAATGPEITLTVEPVPGSDLVEFRCETIVVSSLSAVVSLFEDTDSMPGWVFRMKEARTLRRMGPTEVIAYTVTGLPWPLEDRDSVILTMVYQDNTGVVYIKGTDYSQYLPVQKGMVRMKRIRSSWRFEPLPESRLRVIFTGTGDPGGIIPLWIFNSMVHEAPYQTMKKFRDVILKEKYQKASYSYIKEYPDGIPGSKVKNQAD